MRSFRIEGMLSDTLACSRRTWLDNFYDPDHFVALHRSTYSGCKVIERKEEVVVYELSMRFLGFRPRSRATVAFHPPDTVEIHATVFGLDTRTFWKIAEIEKGIEASCRYTITLPLFYRPLAPLVRRVYERQNRALWYEDVPALLRIEKLLSMGYVDRFPSPVPRAALAHCRPVARAAAVAAVPVGVLGA